MRRLRILVFATLCGLGFLQPASGQTWHWQYPLPHGNTVNDIVFTDAQQGWAVADGATLTRSTDGGETWQLQPTGIALDMRFLAVEFSSPDEGWILGRRDMSWWYWETFVYRTTDGGESWVEMEDLTAITAKAIAAPAPGQAIVIGFYSQPVYHGRLWRTTTGGLTWDVVDFDTLGLLEKIVFVDELNGWITDNWGTSLRTTDGGASWEPSRIVPTEALPQGLAFTDTARGWVSVRSHGLFHTTDSGESWSVVNAHEGEAQQLCFANELHGWMTSSWAVKHTLDGGATWEAIPPDEHNYFHGLRLAEEGQLWAVGNVGTIQKLNPDGETWTRKAGIGGFGSRDLFMLSELDGWTIGGSKLLHTTNGGVEWVMQPGVIDTIAVTDLAFTDSLHGWILSQGGTVLRTQDGGASWHVAAGQVNLAGTYCVSMAFADTLHGWLSYFAWEMFNEFWCIANTTDGGETWNLQFSRPFRTPAYGMHFTDPNHGWVWGDQAGVWRTTNGGQVWDSVMTPATFYIHDFCALDSEYCWVITDDAAWASTDGGDSWDSLQTPMPLFNIFFRDREHGWAQSWVEGIIRGLLQTTDGGQSWDLVPDYPGAGFISRMAFVNEQIWTSVEGGAIIHYGFPPAAAPEPPAPRPSLYSLSAAPNPFNPTTTLAFNLPRAGKIALVVYDVTGRQVALLSEGSRAAGAHTVRWDASGLPSGLYFVRLETAEQQLTRKVVLLR